MLLFSTTPPAESVLSRSRLASSCAMPSLIWVLARARGDSTVSSTCRTAAASSSELVTAPQPPLGAAAAAAVSFRAGSRLSDEDLLLASASAEARPGLVLAPVLGREVSGESSTKVPSFFFL